MDHELLNLLQDNKYKKLFFVDLRIIVDEEEGAADQLVGGEEWRTDATILDQLQTVQVHVLEIGK